MPSRPRPLLLLAVALLVAAALLGCRHKAHKGEEEGGAPLAGGRVSTKLEEGAKREITTLWALERRGKVLSGFGVADVTVGPAKAGEGTVEFHEREVGTSAPEWHASGRMAVCNAALIVGRPLHDTKIDISLLGPLDGPSAGSSLAVALVAALTGTPLELPERPGPGPITESGLPLSNRPEPAMSGVALPDGTVGAVWALPQKLDAAQQALRTRVVIPGGQRRDYDVAATPPAWVDVVQRGTALKLEMREAGTLAEVYKEFTGKELPWPKGASPTLEGRSDPRLVNAAKRRLAAAGDDLGRAAKGDAAVLERVTELGAYDPALAEGAYQVAYSYLADADYGAAYEIATEVQRACGAGLRMTRVLTAWKQSDGDRAALAELARGQAPDAKRLEYFRSRADELIAEAGINLEQPTIADVQSLADTYATGLAAVALLRREEKPLLDAIGAAETEGAALAATRRLLTIYSLADATLAGVESRAGMGLGAGGAAAPKSEELAAWAGVLEPAARANLEYLERSVVPARARDLTMEPEAFRQWLLAQDTDYARCVGCIAALDMLEPLVGKEGPVPLIARYGLSIEGLTLSSLLVARYYSIDTRFDPATRQAATTNRPALHPMVLRSQARALDLIAGAQEAHANTTVASCYAATAEALLRRMPGDPARKLQALACYWRASLYARTATLLATPLEEPKKETAKGKGKSGSKAHKPAAAH